MRQLQQSSGPVPPPGGPVMEPPAAKQHGGGGNTTAILVGLVGGLGSFCFICTSEHSIPCLECYDIAPTAAGTSAS